MACELFALQGLDPSHHFVGKGLLLFCCVVVIVDSRLTTIYDLVAAALGRLQQYMINFAPKRSSKLRLL